LNRSVDEFRALERAVSHVRRSSPRGGMEDNFEPLLEADGAATVPLASHMASARRRSDSGGGRTPRGDSSMAMQTEAADMMRRWQRVLGQEASMAATYGATPRSARGYGGREVSYASTTHFAPRARSVGERQSQHYGRRCRTAHDVVDHHLHFLRGLTQEPSVGIGGRPYTPRV
jgi:hypothetical protein